MAADLAPCAACGHSCDTGTALYDSRAGLYFCDEQCFADWADGHSEEVTEFYRLMNVE